MSKEKKGYSIGEISELLGIKEHTVRFWEKEFPMLQPIRNASGRRKYTEEDLTILQNIKKLLYDKGFTTQGALKELQALHAKVVIHEDDLFYSSSGTTESYDKLKSHDLDTTIQARVKSRNIKSSGGVDSLQTHSRQLEKNIERTIISKIYDKVNHLIHLLENE